MLKQRLSFSGKHECSDFVWAGLVSMGVLVLFIYFVRLDNAGLVLSSLIWLAKGRNGRARSQLSTT